MATPGSVRAVLGALLERFPAERLAVHFHDTRGTALANVLAALELGIVTVDASAGGLGGCPYAPGAAGNLATEDLLYMLHGMGIETGVDLAAVTAATHYLAAQLGTTPASTRNHPAPQVGDAHPDTYWSLPYDKGYGCPPP